MYKIYVEVSDKTHLAHQLPRTRITTESPIDADRIFREQLNRSELCGAKAHVVLSRNNVQLAYHRFDKSPGDAQYFDQGSEIAL